MKRLVSALLCLCILLTLLPVSAMAAENVSSGSCGDNLTWELDAEGTLTISGTGICGITPGKKKHHGRQVTRV